MAPSPIRLAILEADTPLAKTRAKYGGYGGVFTSLLHKGADAINIPRGQLDISGWDVVNAGDGQEGGDEHLGGQYDWKRRRGYPKMEDVDAVLITGSRMWVSSLARAVVGGQSGGRQITPPRFAGEP